MRNIAHERKLASREILRKYESFGILGDLNKTESLSTFSQMHYKFLIREVWLMRHKEVSCPFIKWKPLSTMSHVIDIPQNFWLKYSDLGSRHDFDWCSGYICFLQLKTIKNLRLISSRPSYMSILKYIFILFWCYW